MTDKPGHVTRIQWSVWDKCREFYEGAFDWNTINLGWKAALVRAGYQPKGKKWGDYLLLTPPQNRRLP